MVHFARGSRLLGRVSHLFGGGHLALRDGSGEDHEQGSGVVFHASFDTVMDNVHQINPVLFVLSGHAGVSLIGDVVECLHDGHSGGE